MVQNRLSSAVLLTLSLVMTGISMHSSAGEQGLDISLEGVVDLHVHAGPDSRPRSVSDLEAARGAKDAGMRAILLKNHFTMTADRAALAMEQVENLEIFGGVVLNRAVGATLAPFLPLLSLGRGALLLVVLG